MKNTFLKISTLVIFLSGLTGCEFSNLIVKPEPNVKGIWENNIKNSDGSSVLTTLEIKDFKKVVEQKYGNYKEEYYTYSANLNSKLNGNQSDNLKLTTNNINISGVMNNDSYLQITDVESENESITTRSGFNLSKDGNYLTLVPGDIKFRRK